MATNITFTLNNTSSQGELGPQRGPSGRVRETVTAVGSSSVVGDDGTYVPAYCHKNCICITDGFEVTTETDTIGGASLVLTASEALASRTVNLIIEGDF